MSNFECVAVSHVRYFETRAYVLFECPGYGYHYEEHRGIITKVSRQRKEGEVVKREEGSKPLALLIAKTRAFMKTERSTETITMTIKHPHSPNVRHGKRLRSPLTL